MHTRKLCLSLLLVVIVLTISGCMMPRSIADSDALRRQAQSAGFEEIPLMAGPFTIYTLSRITQPNTSAIIYLEGDGRAYIHKQLSKDPTPYYALALRLALLDPHPNVIYIARPCQFIMTRSCDSKYWANERYGHTIIQSLDAALTQLEKRYHLSSLQLVGHSGGGALAVLLAARHKSITSITTVAGNLDLKAMAAYHKTPPLLGSEDPLHYAQQIRHLPQLHLSGSNDKIVPPKIAAGFVQLQNSPCSSHQILKGFTHEEGWLAIWPKIVQTAPTCNQRS